MSSVRFAAGVLFVYIGVPLTFWTFVYLLIREAGR